MPATVIHLQKALCLQSVYQARLAEIDTTLTTPILQ